MLVVQLAGLVLPPVSAQAARSCATETAALQAQADSALERAARDVRSARESPQATAGRQPTPESIARAEEQLGAWGEAPDLLSALGQARQAAKQGDEARCEALLRRAREALATRP